MIVQKYGGTSVATIEKIKLVAKSIAKRLEKEKKMIVVVSAMSGETDKLINLGKSVGLEEREFDQLVSLGENKTISLLAGTLCENGVKAVSLTGWQAGLITTDDFSYAKINKIKIKKILSYLDKNDVAIVAGFQGVTKNGDVTTLGKGGSDTTAVALAGALKCGCEIFTDVCGIFAADPKVLKDAKKLEKIGFDCLMEMASCGAKVMETRSVEIAKKYHVELYIGQSLTPIEEGTKVEYEENFESAVIKTLTVKSGVMLVEIFCENQFDFQDVLYRCKRSSQNFEMFSYEESHGFKISFILNELSKNFAESLKQNLGSKICTEEGFSKLTIVGAGFRTHKDIVAKVLAQLYKENIFVKKIMLSEISIEILVRDKDKQQTVEVLNTMFGFESKKINIAIVGATGLVGRTFLEILQESHLKNQINDLYLFASEKSAGKILIFDGQEKVVETLNEENIKSKKIDYVFFSAGEKVSKAFANIFVETGAVVIDNSSAFRMDKEVPLIVPEVNFENMDSKIISNPNCSTIQCVVPLYALKKHFGLKHVSFATYQAVSGSGAKGVQDFLSTQQGENPKFYPYPIFNNCLPQIGGFLENGYTTEEMKMVNETRKILGDDLLAISATCVRVPVKNCHSVLVSATLDKEVSIQEVVNAFERQEGLVVLNDLEKGVYPINKFADGKNPVFVGRIKKDLCNPNEVHFWCVADNVRKGAALNGVQILEKLLNNN